MAIGFLLHLLTGLPFWAGTLIGAVIILIYTWTCGLWAVIMTDFIQFFVMMVATGLALILGWNGMGGYERVIVGLENYAGDYSYFFQGGRLFYPWILLATRSPPLLRWRNRPFSEDICSAGPKEIRKAFIGIPMWLTFDWIVVFLGVWGGGHRAGLIPG